MAITVSPGCSTEKYTAMLAELPQCGCTFTWSAPNSFLARSMAIFSATSTHSHPPYQRLPG